MKRIFFSILTAVSLILTACNVAVTKDGGNKDTCVVTTENAMSKANAMTMTTEKSEVNIYMYGTGTASIDWGDGSGIETKTLEMSEWTHCTYSYPGESYRTKTVSGDNIMGLQCTENLLSNLDVSNNPHLKELSLYRNSLTSAALNALFETLPNNSLSKIIYIAGNPGSSTCNRNIATSKGWNFQ
jgi:hypothetical protein